MQLQTEPSELMQLLSNISYMWYAYKIKNWRYSKIYVLVFVYVQFKHIIIYYRNILLQIVDL